MGQGTLGDLVILSSLMDLQALVALGHLQSHIHPAEQHRELSNSGC